MKSNKLVSVILATAILFSFGCIKKDPLSSWNDGNAKKTIITFVKNAVDKTSGKFIPEKDRVVVFDNDGTLLIEKPYYLGPKFYLKRHQERVKKDPSLTKHQFYKAVADNDMEYVKKFDMSIITFSFKNGFIGYTPEKYINESKKFLKEAKHPRFDVTYDKLVYKPMLELLDYLRSEKFRIFISTGSDVDFVRAMSEEVYNIPRENVIGTTVSVEYTETDKGINLYRTASDVSFNYYEKKPINIYYQIGRRPVLAFGNTSGDITMLKYSCSQANSLCLALDHDDEIREYKYTNAKLLKAASENNWTVVSMKKDFKKVF